MQWMWRSLSSSSFGSSVSWMGLEVVGLRMCSVQFGVGTWFWIQQSKIIVSKRNRREKQRDPRIVDSRKTVKIVRFQYDRCSRSNDAWFKWSSEFTSITWRGDVTSDVISSRRIIFEGITSSSACNSWPAMTAILSGTYVQSWRVGNRLCHPVTPAASGIRWRRRNILKRCIIRHFRWVLQYEVSKHRSSNSAEWHVAAPGNDTPTQNRVSVGSEFCSAESVFSSTNCSCLLSGKTDWIRTLLFAFYILPY